MADFVKGSLNLGTPFGVNEYLRSTKDVKLESYTVAASTVPTVPITDNSVTYNQKILDRGVVMAKITSGPEIGKIGPYSTDNVGVTDGRAATANIVGLNDTFLPWQMLDRDVEVAVAYECTAVQAWCIEYIAAGAKQALSNATATAMLSKGVSIHFH